MAVEIEFSLVDTEFRRAMDRLIARASDLTPLMGQIAGHLAASAERSFEAQAGPDGAPWVKLDPSTIAQRTRRGTWPGQMLQVTGDLAASGVAQHGSDFAELVFGAPHAVYHQLGTRHMQARPFLGLDEQAEADIRDAAVAWLDI